MLNLIDDFIDYGKNKNFRVKTLWNHRSRVKRFFNFINLNYPDVEEITDITREMVKAYEKELTVSYDALGKLMTVDRRYRYLSTLKSFFEYLEREEKIYKNPASQVALPRLRKKLLRNILTEEEMQDILKTCSKNTINDIRDRAILEVLYSTALRADELCSVEIEDLDLDERTIFVRNPKMGLERFVPFGESALYWTKTYLEKVRPLLGAENDLLFVSFTGRRFSRDTLCRIVKERVKNAEIDKVKITTHSFRHSCASHMVKHGADIRYVQKHLGHKRISTTEKYLQIEISDLKEVHARTHPRELEDW